MRKLLVAMLVALLMVGCGEDTKKPGEDGPEANQSSAETIDLDDNETRKRIITEAIDSKKLEWRVEEGEELAYAPNQQTPYAGWVKRMRDDGQIWLLTKYKDGKRDGPATSWYDNGQKKAEYTRKHDKLITAVAWKPNGEKCPETNVLDGSGVRVLHKADGTERFRITYKDGEPVED